MNTKIQTESVAGGWSREEVNAAAFVVGDLPVPVAKMEVRPVSLASLMILERLGNPLAASLLSGGEAQMNLYAMSEFLWVHAGDWQEVRRLAARAELNQDVIFERVTDFVKGMGQEDLSEVFAHMTRAGEEIRNSAARVLPNDHDKETPSKN